MVRVWSGGCLRAIVFLHACLRIVEFRSVLYAFECVPPALQVMYRDPTGDCDECNFGYYGRTVRVGAAARSLWFCERLSRVFYSGENFFA
jgi:hypothetical protein